VDVTFLSAGMVAWVEQAEDTVDLMEQCLADVLEVHRVTLGKGDVVIYEHVGPG